MLNLLVGLMCFAGSWTLNVAGVEYWQDRMRKSALVSYAIASLLALVAGVYFIDAARELLQ